MTIHRSDLVLLKSSIFNKCEKCPLMDGKEKTCQTSNKDTFLRFVLETELSDPCSKYKIQFKDKIAEIWRLNKGDLYLYRDEVFDVKFGYKNKLLDGKKLHECRGVPINRKALAIIFYYEGRYAYFERVSVPYKVKITNEGYAKILNKNNELVAKVRYIHEIQAFIRQTRKSNASI